MDRDIGSWKLKWSKTEIAVAATRHDSGDDGGDDDDDTEANILNFFSPGTLM